MSQPADPSRRDFLRAGAAAGFGSLLSGAPANPSELPTPDSGLSPADPLEVVRIGFVGLGGQGSVHLENLLTLEGVEITAVCDIVPEKVARWQRRIRELGRPEPAGYDRGPRDFERLCAEQDLDLVYNATPWEWHVPICLAAMAHGKHAASEVPLAYTVDDCWALVEAAEKYRRHCVMMENCCYDRLELLALHLARLGLLGELLHAECGYNHDLRSVKFSTEGEGLWRRAHATRRNGNLYPTHGLGPIAQAVGINRGNQFDELVSMSGNSRGLQLWQAERLPPGDSRRNERYRLGDINISLIRTVRGQTVVLWHDTNLPRPYSRKYLLQGTRGLVEGYPRRVYVEGRSRDHRWDDIQPWFDRYDHPLWKDDQVRSQSRGHGGMDWLENWRLITCLRQGLPTDQDVYDGAAWSVIGPLTEWSVANRSRPARVPDFTRGNWRTREPLGIIAP